MRFWYNECDFPAETAYRLKEADTTPPFSRIQVRSKIWLEIGGEPVFGQGREELLRLVRKNGSINAAAKEMGVPYRKAWTYIDSMEKRLGVALVLRRRGSRTEVTPEAVALLEKFDALREGFDLLVNRKFGELGF